jgi:predicted HTH domain antitoxin
MSQPDRAARTRTVSVDLPVEALPVQPWNPRAIAEGLRLLWLIDQVRQGAVSTGKGAELAGLPKATFLRALGQHGVPVIHVDPEDYESEFAPPGMG